MITCCHKKNVQLWRFLLVEAKKFLNDLRIYASTISFFLSFFLSFFHLISSPFYFSFRSVFLFIFHFDIFRPLLFIFSFIHLITIFLYRLCFLSFPPCLLFLCNPSIFIFKFQNPSFNCDSLYTDDTWQESHIIKALNALTHNVVPINIPFSFSLGLSLSYSLLFSHPNKHAQTHFPFSMTWTLMKEQLSKLHQQHGQKKLFLLTLPLSKCHCWKPDIRTTKAKLTSEIHHMGE